MSLDPRTTDCRRSWGERQRSWLLALERIKKPIPRRHEAAPAQAMSDDGNSGHYRHYCLRLPELFEKFIALEVAMQHCLTMQGTYRFALAMTVVFYHFLRGPLAERGIAFAGNFAVLGFYALSGFLITMAVEKNYGADFQSLKRFAANRFLRLFPAYWTVLLIAAAGVLIFPDVARAINQTMVNPANGRFGALGWLPQVSMVGLQLPPAFLWPERLIPPAWSTAMEVYAYFCLALVSVIPNRTFRYVFLGCLIVGLACALTGKAQWTYTSFFGVAALFAGGSLAWRERDVLGALLARYKGIAPVALVTFLLVAFAPDIFYELRSEQYLVWGQYLIIPLVAILAFVTVTARKENRFTTWLADISYPVFLAHFPVSIWVGAAGFEGAAWVAISTIATLAVSAAIVKVVEHPIANVRSKLRQGGTPVRVP